MSMSGQPVGLPPMSSTRKTTPFLIGVAGGTASGKSTVCRKIMDKLGQDSRIVCISQDSFYRELQEHEREDALKGCYNFDHPDALDNVLIERVLTDILNGKEVEIPIYDFTSMRYVCEKVWLEIYCDNSESSENEKNEITHISDNNVAFFLQENR